MEKKKITVKLVNVSHYEWVPIAQKINEKHNTNYICNKDTYQWLADEKVCEELEKIKQELENNDKIILISKGGI
jgi:hypothetical protein